MDPYIGREILGQFCITEKIGQGGMGAVYKAEQPSMDRLVAVKILHPRLAARPDLVTRFKREAKAMSRLTHPNTVRVYLYGELETGRELYIVMEFLDGSDLMRVLRRDGPMDVARAARVLVHICGALEEAHNAAIVHRDLKPENIILTTQGGIPDFPKVLDFGLAKIRDMDGHRVGGPILTQQGMVFGTPEFMSPEQAQGLELDRRTDIYSLGIIFYEMIVGRLPFKAQSPVDFIGHHLKTPPIPIAERAPERRFAPEVWPVVARSIEKNPDRRYQTAAEFAQALASLVDGSGAFHRPTPARPSAVVMQMPAPVVPVAASYGAASAASSGAARAAPAVAPPPAAAQPPRSGVSGGLVIALAVAVALLLVALVVVLAIRSPDPPPAPVPASDRACQA